MKARTKAEREALRIAALLEVPHRGIYLDLINRVARLVRNEAARECAAAAMVSVGYAGEDSIARVFVERVVRGEPVILKGSDLVRAILRSVDQGER